MLAIKLPLILSERLDGAVARLVLEVKRRRDPVTFHDLL